MRNLTTLCLLLCSCTTFSMHLKDALNNNLVQITWQGTKLANLPEPSDKEMLKPKISMEITNLTRQDLTLDLEEGYMLKPVENGYQKMLITERLAIDLKPNELLKRPLYAMCTQLTHSAPNVDLKFTITDKATGALLALANFIAVNNLQNFASQEAVWSLTDDADILGITASNKAIENQLQSFVAGLKKVNLATLKERAKNTPYEERSIVQLYQGKKIDRNIPFKNEQPIVASIGYYDRNGNLLQSILDEQFVTIGTHSIRYDPYPLSLNHKRYSVRMYKDGDLFREYFFSQ